MIDDTFFLVSEREIHWWESGKPFSKEERKAFCDVIRNRPHTSTPAHPPEAQQRIDAAIKALEIMRDRNDKKGNPVDLNFNDGVAYGCEEAIALLQAGDHHE